MSYLVSSFKHNIQWHRLLYLVLLSTCCQVANYGSVLPYPWWYMPILWAFLWVFVVVIDAAFEAVEQIWKNRSN